MPVCRPWSTSRPWKEWTNYHCWVWMQKSLNGSLVDVRMETGPPFTSPPGLFYLAPLLCLCFAQSSLPIRGSTHHTNCISSSFLSPLCLLLKILNARVTVLFAHYFWCLLCLDTHYLSNRCTSQRTQVACCLRHILLVNSEVHLSSICIWISGERTDDG